MNSPRDPNEPERRQYIRVKKNFVLKFHLEGAAETDVEITQLKNISQGGMCFITAKPYSANAKIVIDLRTPYLVDEAHLQGTILESHERIKGIIYETRVKFDQLTPQAKFLIEKLEEFFKKGEHNDHE